MNEATVPIILTVGSQAKAFSSGSVNGGVWSHNKHSLFTFNVRQLIEDIKYNQIYAELSIRKKRVL